MRLAAIVLGLGLVAVAVGCGPTTGSGSTVAPTASAATPSPTPADSASPPVTPTTNEPTKEPVMPFTLTSTAFSEGGAIPRIHTCDGDDVSPPLAWAGAPDGTVSLALIVDDPDAGGFIHWLAYAMDPVAGSLPEGVSGVEGGISEGINSFGNVGYGGPCPPSGTHRYVFRLLALDVNPSFSGPPEATDLEAATAGHVLGEARITGTYKRGG